MRIFLVLLVLSLEASAQWWSVETSGLNTNLRGVSVQSSVGSDHKSHYQIWASGSNGVILRSSDDGKSWKRLSAPAADLDFRGIAAFSENTAYVMSSGDGDKSRIYKTTDGGKTWMLQYTDQRPGFFLDALACQSPTRCFALSDPVDGKFLVLATEDGEHWKELPRDKMPPALPGEGAFAASGSALALCEDGSIYFGSGIAAARVYRSSDGGRSWKAVATPIPAGPSSGVFSVACQGLHDALVAVGGDYREPSLAKRVAIYSRDAGKTWQLAAAQPRGYRSAVGWSSKGDFVAVGPNGTDISHDQGVHWKAADRLSLNALSFSGGQGWAVGEKGTIARFNTASRTRSGGALR